MRLNLGCGPVRLRGWVNVDKIAASQPDQVVDLEVLPWPWPDDSVEEVVLSHVLEHLGARSEIYIGIMQELYRVCRHGARITIAVPHPRHDFFLDDPTHVRIVTPDGLLLFSQAANREAEAANGANTPLGTYYNVDFAIESVKDMLDPYWHGRAQRKEITPQELDFAAKHYNNVVVQTTIVLRALKPPGAAL